ncbi:DMT family transporter [Paracoccus tibetensis]|uniref:Permease of the drug/metabolite transporter (DMT) superfamily n=1 Tax=Paracoccus tibetensis TaxID=336292 RepID=A0A1G5F965_9RHOB|nr:DMT family transporter [Paracoccus tibetensis]SCY35188.1 Permease of the drug/metabolite transporter (DMT) superfamily [Paracoccus tibetensis]
MTENTRAALLMTAAMALFAMEDAFVKTLTASLPVPQLLAMTGAAGMVVFWLRMKRRRQPLFSAALLHPMVMARNLGEVVGAFGFVTALAWGDLAVASAILQVLPLTLVMGAALFLGEAVGWRRWLSVAVGFAGVLLILRPGAAGVEPSALLAVVGVAGLTLRDLATRRIPPGVPSDQLSASAFGAMVPAGLALTLASGTAIVVPGTFDTALLAGTVLFGVLGYAALVAASRLGEASVVAPFRYTRLAFALVVAAVVFGERPDALTLAGAALIAAAGAYAMWREARVRRPAQPVDGLVRPGSR